MHTHGYLRSATSSQCLFSAPLPLCPSSLAVEVDAPPLGGLGLGAYAFYDFRFAPPLPGLYGILLLCLRGSRGLPM
jgi:hypothetical protein